MGRFDIAKGVKPKPQAPSKEVPDRTKGEIPPAYKASSIHIRPILPQTELYLVRRIDGVIRAIEPITVQDLSFTASAQPGTRGPQFSVNMTFPLYASQASSLFDNDRRLSQRANLVDERLRSEIGRHITPIPEARHHTDINGIPYHTRPYPRPDSPEDLDLL